MKQFHLCKSGMIFSSEHSLSFQITFAPFADENILAFICLLLGAVCSYYNVVILNKLLLSFPIDFWPLFVLDRISSVATPRSPQGLHRKKIQQAECMPQSNLIVLCMENNTSSRLGSYWHATEVTAEMKFSRTCLICSAQELPNI